MTLAAIVMDIVASATGKFTLDQLAMMVQAHTEYRGKSSKEELKGRILRILKEESQRENQDQSDQSESFLKLKLGRFEGKIDLS